MTTATALLTLTVRRTLPAPPPIVYRAWTEPKYAAMWSWGKPHETLSVDIDCRVGGLWRQQIRNLESGDVWTFAGEFREVEANRRLVHTFHWVSDTGIDHGTSLVAIDFIGRGSETDVVITHTQLPSDEIRRGTETGWGNVVDCIGGVLPRVAVARSVAAP